MNFPYSLALFDLDGTLVDTAADIAEAVNRSLRDWQLPQVEEAVIRGWIGDGARVLVETAFRHAGSAVAVDEIMDGFMVHYGQTLLQRAQPYPGVADTLQALQADGVALAVCTNKPQRYVRPLLEHLGIAGFFGAMVGGDTLPERKPSALPLLHLARQFGIAPEASVMVGDSATDAAAARAAGMPLVLVRYGYPRGFDLDSAGALAVIGEMRQLLDLRPVSPASA
ncbi:phosphoglycolate phosphatase [Luteimonas aquatica]|uniref:phosphoglycolate phosphatase n=1 Tax=Luteimonas aquatica TaxID=450364 RepID=UPI001F57C17E|nr:phosphoglycolate phosphatase [Luteimonas aquatica]